MITQIAMLEPINSHEVVFVKPFIFEYHQHSALSVEYLRFILVPDDEECNEFNIINATGNYRNRLKENRTGGYLNSYDAGYKGRNYIVYVVFDLTLPKHQYYLLRFKEPTADVLQALTVSRKMIERYDSKGKPENIIHMLSQDDSEAYSIFYGTVKYYGNLLVNNWDHTGSLMMPTKHGMLFSYWH